MEEGNGIDHQSKVDLMTWTIRRLLPKLGKFLKQEHNLQTSTPMKEDIESLETQLRTIMDAALSEMPRAQQDQLDARDSKHYYHACELRELSYDIEDIVDKASEPIANQDMYSLRKTLENIKVRVKYLAAWRIENFVPTTTTSTVNLSLEDTFKQQARQLIGVHMLKAEVISMMSSPSQQLKIVSIWGAGGIGKTTLAKAVYENTKGDFHCSAFVPVGRQADIKKALRNILIHLGNQRYSDDNLNMTRLNKGQLINELQHFLKGKRFLIVIDDIRDISSWEVIKCALKDNGCGSRIITTSRVLGVAESSGEVLKMMPLSIDGSKELFYATLLCGRNGTIDDLLDEHTTEHILQKCGCVPLAVIMIASLLAGRPQEEWTKVYNSIGFGQEDNIDDENNTRKIIQFSYYDLPSHLKTCLLYLSIFPDDHVIEKDMLVWRWAAEGFLHDDEEQGESLFKVGERYLYELVSRSMILAVENEETNICVCSVEGMVLDWIHTVAKEEKFVTVLSGDHRDARRVTRDPANRLNFCRLSTNPQKFSVFVGSQTTRLASLGDQYDHDDHQSNNAPIMAVQNRALDKYHDLARMWKPKLRSFNGIGCHINSRIPLLAHCRVLRVLSLQGCELTADNCSDGLKNLFLEKGLKNLIAGLLQLRFLGLGGTFFRDLGIEIGHLRYLQTLDLTDTNIWALPHGVTQLRQLKCLRCINSTSLGLPAGIGNLTSLEELCLGRVNGEELNVFAEELSKLTELRVLRIHSHYILEALVQSLSKLQKIEVVELRTSLPIKKPLYVLMLGARGAMGAAAGPRWRREKAKLVSFVDRLHTEAETSLQVMGFTRVGSQVCWHHVIAPGAFPKLDYMKMDTWLISQPGAMPRLKSIELVVDVRALKDDANFDFHDFYKLSYLRLLEKAHVGINCREAKIEEAEEVEAALRHAVQTHPNRPKLILNRVGRCVDDKQIHSLGGLPQFMPLELLREITNRFSKKQILGSGTFGTVYKGVLNGKEVAVKMLRSMPPRLNYEEEFLKEFENLRRLNHPNIVQLFGYCYEVKRVTIEHEGRSVFADEIDRALCFDYMHNGSLQQHLDDESCGLDWQTRYKIIKGSCEGLKYLHTGLENPMFHLDLKPGNILLDKNMVPKIADFGLSTLVCNNETRATSSFWGTKRYCPREYIDHGNVSNKFDVFSLGVVMIELIAGSEGYNKAYEMPSQEFIDHVQENWRKRLQATPGCTSLIYECRQVQRCLKIALDCISADRKQRPNIGDITNWLNEIENITEKLATTSTSENET